MGREAMADAIHIAGFTEKHPSLDWQTDKPTPADEETILPDAGGDGLQTDRGPQATSN